MSNTTDKDYLYSQVIVIGAGAAGLAVAGFIRNRTVTVLERNEKPGKKLYITGKGRCNVTNACEPEEFFVNVVNNPKFLFSSVYGFSPSDTVKLFESMGVATKTERGNRVFPVSDKASDVIRALYKAATANGAKFVFDCFVTSVAKTDEGFEIRANGKNYRCDALVIATGGKSYPATGSDGSGYDLASKLGHTVVEPKPSLVPLILKENVSELAGLSLKNVTASVVVGSQTYTEFGEMLFTHRGVSGPAVLRLSSRICRLIGKKRLIIDLKPALSVETLDKRVSNDLKENQNKQLKNALDKLLPKAMIMPVINASGVSPEKKVNVITVGERAAIVHALKNLTYEIVGTESFENAIITSGGVSVKEVSPKTMESKVIKRLYFVGEVLDVDALTGGFNIQIALSTAYSAAKAISYGGGV